MKTESKKTKTKKDVKIDLFEKEKEVISESNQSEIIGGDGWCENCHEPNGQSKIPAAIGTDI